jgi:predicted nucleic acid-binding protein
MHCLDSTYLIDLAHNDEGAVRKARAFETRGERCAVAAPTVTEVLLGAHHRGGAYLRRMLELVEELSVLDTTLDIAAAAGELGAAMKGHGQPTPIVDLIIAQTARKHGAILLTRDVGFTRIPGLACESY